MTNYRSNKNYKINIESSEKIICALTYLTTGLVGFIWLIFAHVKKRHISSFAKYNIFQSLFISIILYIAKILLGIIVSVAQIIPILGSLVINIVYYLAQYPVFMNFSLIETVMIAVYFYLAYFAFMGKYPRLPVISDWVKQMM